MKMKCLPLYVALVFGGLMLISCSSTLKPEPPKTVTDPTVVATYKKAVAGDVKSLRFISAQYKAGAAGFPKSPRQAANALYMAANAGDTQSQLELAKCYEEGYGRMQDISKAAGWYHKAGEQGSKMGKSKAKELAQIIAEAREERRREELRRQGEIVLSDSELIAKYNETVRITESSGMDDSSIGLVAYRWAQPDQKSLIYNETRRRANLNEGAYYLYLLGVYTWQGYGCAMNRQLGIQYLRQAASVGVRHARGFLNSIGTY